MKYYAGIGSRSTPQNILDLMTKLARKLSEQDFHLRSGGALGADTAFQMGARFGEIWSPRSGTDEMVNGLSIRRLPKVLPESHVELVRATHPAFHRLDSWTLRLHVRNNYVLLGEDMQFPVDFVLCWTSDGLASGGTGQALRVAKLKGIPIYNLANRDALGKAEAFLA